MSDQTFTTIPPRAPTNPLQPAPMTNMGVLADFGAPSDNEPISDIVPDFGWMSEMEIYKSYFTFSVNQSPGTELGIIYPMQKNNSNDPNMTRLYKIPADWHFLPFCSSRWWSGNIRLRFMAIKPKEITGKLLIKWYPDLSFLNPSQPADTLARSVKYEWDLGTSNEYSLIITGYNITRLRQTWLPLAMGASKDVTPTLRDSMSSVPPLMQFTFGYLRIYSQSRLQVGSLYPDSIRILVFLSFSDASFHTSTDVRGEAFHAFCVGPPPIIEYQS